MKHVTLSLLIALKFWSSVARAQGGAGTHGGDTINPALIAGWFFDEKRVIRVCTELNPKFGVSAPEVRQVITRAFSTWQAYFLERSRVYVVGRPSFNLAFLNRCDGSEDLRFYLGMTSPEVEAEKRYYRAPYAFSRRTAFKIKEYWGKGFVWVRNGGNGFPNWKSPGQLDAFIRHEIGHILGCDHTEGTIMDRDIAKILQKYVGDLKGEEQLTWIDLMRELMLSKKRVYTFKPFWHYYRQVQKTMQFVLGRDWKYDKESVKMELHFDSDAKGKNQLVISDKSYRQTLKLEWGFGALFTTGNQVFRYLGHGSQGVAWGEGASEGQTLYGKITLANGKRYPVLLLRNHGTWYPTNAAELYLLRNGKAEKVFPPLPM